MSELHEIFKQIQQQFSTFWVDSYSLEHFIQFSRNDNCYCSLVFLSKSIKNIENVWFFHYFSWIFMIFDNFQNSFSEYQIVPSSFFPKKWKKHKKIYILFSQGYRPKTMSISDDFLWKLPSNFLAFHGSTVAKTIFIFLEYFFKIGVALWFCQNRPKKL